MKFTYRGSLILPFRIAPVATIIGILNTVIGIAIAPINILITAYFINTALAVVRDGQDASTIVLPLVAMAAFSVYGYITRPLLDLLAQNVGIKRALYLREIFLEKRARLEYKHTENKDIADLLRRIWSDPSGEISRVLSNLIGFISIVGTTVSYAVILLVNAPIAGAILIVLSVPIFIIASKGGKANYQANREATRDQRMSWNLSYILQSRNEACERNMFGYSEHISKKYVHHHELGRIHNLKVNAIWFARSKASAIILGLLSAASLFLMAPAVANGSLSVGLFIALQGALFSAVQAIGWSLPWHFQQFAHQKEYLKDVNKFLSLSEAGGADALPIEIPPQFESLEFKNVNFTYPGTEKVILNNLNMRLERGKHYSFVGVNGAGKTTITKIITRLYDDYTGEILLNGKCLRQWTLSEIKGFFCVLFQDFARYDITVAENALVGKIHGATDAEVDHALEMSGFDGKAKELKDGKNTLLGKTHDDGVDLSGGQWQRLAFARAILSTAPVKILDEPTSALDPIEESKVYAKFESMSDGFTTIFISHRLASAKLADTIFVLEDGKVAEQGSHDELMTAKGIYAEMFESQQSWYL